MQAISQTEEGIRLKRWVKRHYPRVSDGEFHKLCRSGQLRLNSARCRGDEILKAGDFLRVPPFLASLRMKQGTGAGSGDKFSLSDLEKIRRRIIHDDPDFVVFNKPSGLAVQGGVGIKKSLDKMAAAMFPYDTILPVHRLDKETSGVIVFAKNQLSAQHLAAEFRDKTASKEYLALLSGSVSPRHGMIDNYIDKGRVVEDRGACDGSVKRAVTRYEVIGDLPGILTWIRFFPLTGRTHQLRVHAALSLGAPIVGDSLYYRKTEGGDKGTENAALDSVLQSSRLFLFARRLSFRHPRNGKIITIRAQLPDFMASVAKFFEFKMDF
jgi:23S rRNA pseudouridine955/2504/2580 synthase